MRRFWEERYCAGLMRLVVVGPQPLRELEALVRARFGAVRNLGAAVPAFPGAPPHSLDVARARKYPQACMFQSCSVPQAMWCPARRRDMCCAWSPSAAATGWASSGACRPSSAPGAADPAAC